MIIERMELPELPALTVKDDLYPSEQWVSHDADATHLRIAPGIWPTHIELDGTMYEFGLHLYDDTDQIESTLYYRRDRGHTINVKSHSDIPGLAI